MAGGKIMSEIAEAGNANILRIRLRYFPILWWGKYRKSSEILLAAQFWQNQRNLSSQPETLLGQANRKSVWKRNSLTEIKDRVSSYLLCRRCLCRRFLCLCLCVRWRCIHWRWIHWRCLRWRCLRWRCLGRRCLGRRCLGLCFWICHHCMIVEIDIQYLRSDLIL